MLRIMKRLNIYRSTNKHLVETTTTATNTLPILQATFLVLRPSSGQIQRRIEMLYSTVAPLLALQHLHNNFPRNK